MKKLKKLHKLQIRKKIIRKKSKTILSKKIVKISKKKKKPAIVISSPIKIESNVSIPLSEILPKKQRKKRSVNVTKMYFTQDTEDAIILYNAEQDMGKRDIIFQDRILYPFQKLVENIFNTFKFSYFETGPQDVQKECLTHLVSNIHKFDPTRVSKTDPEKKSKAYSYFSIIAKHYLILLNNTNYKKFNKNVEISDDHEENTIQLQQDDKYYAQQEMSDFIRLTVEFWENNISKIFNKQRDVNIANAVVELMRKSDTISMFNKKALYLYIRELSECKTQQITKVINKMKIHQKQMTKNYLDHGVI